MLSLDAIDKSAKIRSTDRVFILKKKDIKVNTKSSSGIIDNRLFTGENRLHAIQNPETSLWSFKYEHGMTPSTLKSSFTSWQKAYEFIKVYFENRNIEITEVLS